MMPLPRLALVYGASLICMLAIDAVWLTLATEWLYRPHMADLLADSFRPLPAVIFYLLYAAGLVGFAVRPLETATAARAALRGACLGLVAYGTYDLTNHAILRSWSTLLTVADMAWGTVLTAVVATIGRWVADRLDRSAQPA